MSRTARARTPYRPCRHGSGGPVGETSVLAAMRTAEIHCIDRGRPLTPWRRDVLRALLRAGRPMKAYDLSQEVMVTGRPSPPSVYRALDALVEAGLVQKVSSQDAFFAVPSEFVGAQLAVISCDCCGVLILSRTAYQSVRSQLAQSDFAITDLTVEGIGACPVCRRGDHA